MELIEPGVELMAIDCRSSRKKSITRKRGMAARVLLVASAVAGAAGTISYAQPQSAVKEDRNLRSQALADDRQAAEDRLELVLPPPAGFHPEPGESGIRLKLFAEKETIYPGEEIRYRLEVFNGAATRFRLADWAPSFFKTGRLPSDLIRLVIVDPKNHEKELLSPLNTRANQGGEMRFPAGLSGEQKEARFEKERARARADERLFVELAPGETLRTRADTAGSLFRVLRVRVKLDSPGTYRLRAELLGEARQAIASSNIVRIEVAK